MRILYVSWIAPVERRSATLAMRRHFVERADFEVLVATSGDFQHPEIRQFPIKRPAGLQRVSDTRLCRLVRNYEILVRGRSIPPRPLDVAREFQPDCVFTVADLTLPDLKLWDPSPNLLDNSTDYYMVSPKGQPLYVDSSHLSQRGVELTWLPTLTLLFKEL